MSTGSLFEHTSSFDAGQVGGHVHVGRFEAAYEELFAEVLEDGVITTEERQKLEKAASDLGLDRARIGELERALTAAYEIRHRVAVRHDDAPAAPAPLPEGAEEDPRIAALQQRIAYLEQRVSDLTRELDEARANVAIEVDFSGVDTTPATETEELDEIFRRVRHAPREVVSLRALFRAASARGEVDRAYGAAHALSYLGAATDEEKALYDKNRPEWLIKPSSALDREAWKRLLLHPDQEILAGEIFASVVPAVLLGRVATLRHAKALPALDPQKRVDLRATTVQAARCFGWAASILGMPAPPLYTDPSYTGAVELVPGVPPASRLGKLALSGRAPEELAFLAGRHLAYYREEHFIRLLLPSLFDVEDVFLAALTIGNPGLPLSDEVQRRVRPLADALSPLLEPAQIDRLRGHFLRFVEEGGRTNLNRWTGAADKTACRAGLLLCESLWAAERMLELSGDDDRTEKMDDLIVFLASDRWAMLRKRIGVTAA
ncbi:MAG: hypothetical protein R3B70_09515 [Polyangiaceae bacterium]